jgi:hypothetical protein
MTQLLPLVLGWLPVWAVAFWRRREVHFARVGFAAALVGFIGGMCSVELRRHGLQEIAPGSWSLPVLGLRVEEILRFALQGAAGAILCEVLLSRAGEDAAAGNPGAP